MFQGFVHNTLDVAYSILGESFVLFSSELYKVPDIYLAVTNAACHNLSVLSDFRAKNVFKCVIRPFLLSCPFEYSETIILPFLRSFANYGKKNTK